MEDRYSEVFTVPSHLVDGSKALGAGNILHLFQELSFHGAAQLGCSEEYLERVGYAWIFSRMHFIVERRPKIYETVRMETWSQGLEGLFLIRHYRILDEAGTPLIRGCSSCLTINLATRSLVRSDKVAAVSPYWEQNPLKAASPAGKIVPCEEYAAEPLLSHRVMYSDTDFVGHVNNSQYLRWAVDCEKSVNPEFNLSEVSLNFLKETKLGETIEYYRSERDGWVNYAAKVGDATVLLLEMR